MGWPVRVIRLASNPLEDGLWCGPSGLSLAGRPLVEEEGNGFRPKTLPELQATLNDVYGSTFHLDAQDYLPGLNTVARSLNKGDPPGEPSSAGKDDDAENCPVPTPENIREDPNGPWPINLR